MNRTNSHPLMSGFRHRVPARWLMTVVLVGLLGVITVEITSDFLHHLAHYRQTQALRRVQLVIGHMVRGAQHLAFERGRTNVVLRTATAIGESDRAFIDSRRQQADAEFAAAVQMLDDSSIALARRLSRQRQILTELRQRADIFMAQPRDQRDPLFAERWFNAVSSLLANVPESVFLLGGAEMLPPMARITLQAFDLRDTLGVESSRVAGALASRRVPDVMQMHELARLRGQGDTAWANLRREVALADNASLADSLTRVDMEVYRNFRPLQDAVLHAFANRRLPQEPVPHYTAASVPALDSVAAVMSVAAQEGVRIADAAEAEAGWIMAAYTAVLVACVALATLALVLISRVLRSAAQLRRYLGDLAENRLDTAPPVPFIGRELFELARTTAVLRHSLLERGRMERELDELSRQNRLILENAADGLLALDSQGRAIFSNPAAQRLTGWSLAELQGRSHHEMIHHSLADGSPNPAASCPVHQTLADGASRHVENDLFWRKDGSAFPVDISISSWGEGTSRGVVMVFRDVSERKRIEDRNQALMGELQRSNADLENFAYAVSHDLQAPLRAVAGFVTLTRRALAGTVDDQTQEFMTFAEQGAKRMSEMIAALLDYARVGSQGAPPCPVQLGPVVAQVLGDLAPAISECHGQVTVAEPLPAVLADPAQLGSVLQNLIGNALKYGGGDQPPRIEVAGTILGDHVVLTISDNGPGIPEDLREQVFGLFKRGAPHEGIAGLGMGLAICRRIVDRLGGSIHVEDAPGGGARFVVTLPSVVGTGVTT